jgi:two-component system, OmpR family, KDP operon response regulator KdpE
MKLEDFGGDKVSDAELKVLVIDDEAAIRKLLHLILSAHNYIDEAEANGKDGIGRAATFKPDLMIVDLGLPDMDGKEVVRQVREWSAVPIIVLTARDEEREKIEALDMGADDYVTKPFSTGELLARMRVCLRRVSTDTESPVLCCGDLQIDISKHQVKLSDREIKLTPTEYEIVKVMVQNAGRVLTHKQLLKAVWGNAYNEDTHYIRVYIGQIRRKLEKDPTQPRYIITETGIGYRFMGGE